MLPAHQLQGELAIPSHQHGSDGGLANASQAWRARARSAHNTRPTKHTHQQFTPIPGQMTSHAPRGTRRRSAQCPMQQDVTGRGVFLPQVA